MIRPLPAALLAIAAITALRLAVNAVADLPLFLDEAQYWLWGQEPAFGTFSKPPLIGWAIGLSTALGGDGPFWVRLPAVLGHAGAAIALCFVARVLRPDLPLAVWAGAAYASLPGVSALSLFVSTDDLLLPATALALLAYLRLRAGAGAGWVLILGAALGLGLLAKYAMVYILVLLFALQAVPGWRVPWPKLAAAAAIALFILSPNLIWNAQNGWITFAHTSDNAGWAGIAWNWSAVGEFIGTQLIALGPVLAFAYIAALWWRTPARSFLAALSLPVFIGVGLQALINDAHGNWAAPAFAAASVLGTLWLAQKGRNWLGIGLSVNAALGITLALAPLAADHLRFGGRGLFDRLSGTERFAAEAITAAQGAGLSTLIADERAALGLLAYYAKPHGLSVRAWPPAGGPRNHYEMTRPAMPEHLPALYVGRRDLPADCAAEPIGTVQFEKGLMRGAPVAFVRIGAGCF